VLKRNYRSTKQIEEAALAFLLAGGIENRESLSIAVNEGPRPTLALCQGPESAAIAQLLDEWSRELCLPAYMGAVLTPTNRQASGLAEELNALGVQARACSSSNLDVDERVVKCMTIHTAKGLEFPFVAIAGLTGEAIPRRAYKAADADDLAEYTKQERKLLHVGMARAMKRLVACFPDADPSPFLGDLNNDLWDVRRF
jgi:superfamily I DNA/RNA helicase